MAGDIHPTVKIDQTVVFALLARQTLALIAVVVKVVVVAVVVV